MIIFDTKHLEVRQKIHTLPVFIVKPIGWHRNFPACSLSIFFQFSSRSRNLTESKMRKWKTLYLSSISCGVCLLSYFTQSFLPDYKVLREIDWVNVIFPPVFLPLIHGIPAALHLDICSSRCRMLPATFLMQNSETWLPLDCISRWPLLLGYLYHLFLFLQSSFLSPSWNCGTAYVQKPDVSVHLQSIYACGIRILYLFQHEPGTKCSLLPNPLLEL